MYELQKEEFEHKFTLQRNKEIKLDSELENMTEKYKHEEGRNRQLKMEYDELKFQFHRYKVFRDLKIDQFQIPRMNDLGDDYGLRKEYTYEPQKYTPLMDPIPSERQHEPVEEQPQQKTEQNEQTTAAASVASDRLYRKNMESSVGDLLRWDSTKGVYSGPGTRQKNIFHNKVRSVSSPPTKNISRQPFIQN